tara:strand:+ start:248 stop:472 length:225 start_codon:yes stop_codon:yes gene_type:complete
MKIIDLLFFMLPLFLGFIPARIVYLKLNKKASKYKWLFSILTFAFISVLIGAVLIAIMISQMSFSSGGVHIKSC